eukprot:2776986-Rhodomonas_salina.2
MEESTPARMVHVSSSAHAFGEVEADVYGAARPNTDKTHFRRRMQTVEGVYGDTKLMQVQCWRARVSGVLCVSVSVRGCVCARSMLSVSLSLSLCLFLSVSLSLSLSLLFLLLPPLHSAPLRSSFRSAPFRSSSLAWSAPPDNLSQSDALAALPYRCCSHTNSTAPSDLDPRKARATAAPEHGA